MSTSQFCRAKLVPFDAGGSKLQEANAIALDFNPETLTLKVSGGEQRDRSRRGRQQVQNVGASKATLSFECIFDSTRPRDASGGPAGASGGSGGEEMLDVRTRTKPIANLLQVFGSGREQAPRRVQFRWGTLIFNGVVSQHQEVFDYFSPSGVPLRSKVQLTLTEQEFRYEVNATDAAQRRKAVEQATADARSQAAAANASSLMGGSGLDLSAGFQLSASLDLNLDLNLDLSLSAQVGLSASLGLSADIGVSAGAGIDLDASAAVDLFGPAALGTTADLGRSGVAIPQPSPGLAAAGVPSNPWAPDGPAPGSAAAGLAAVVATQRAGGVATAGAGTAGSIGGVSDSGGRTASVGTPAGSAGASLGGAPSSAPPVRGSPPLAPRRPLDPALPLFAEKQTPLAVAGECRPRWETLPAAGGGEVFRPSASAGSCRGGCGCGCRNCGGGVR